MNNTNNPQTPSSSLDGKAGISIRTDFKGITLVKGHASFKDGRLISPKQNK